MIVEDGSNLKTYDSPFHATMTSAEADAKCAEVDLEMNFSVLDACSKTKGHTMKITLRTLKKIAESKPTVSEDTSVENRGWYIGLEDTGVYYLNTDGSVTHGVEGFWPTEEQAEWFLYAWQNT